MISLGTNSTVDAPMMDQVVTAVGSDHTVVLVTGYAERSWVPGTNGELVAAAGRFGNVVVADWCAAISAQPTLLGPDGVHPTGEGRRSTPTSSPRDWRRRSASAEVDPRRRARRGRLLVRPRVSGSCGGKPSAGPSLIPTGEMLHRHSPSTVWLAAPRRPEGSR
ncbi:hypothetical protein NKG05_25010 [Oerskovia sp. M15]